MGWFCAEIDDKVRTFLARPIDDDWRYLGIDATYVKVLQNGRIVSVAVIAAVGVNSDGRREVLGWTSAPFWTAFLRKLARRDLRDVNPARAGERGAHRQLHHARGHGSDAFRFATQHVWLITCLSCTQQYSTAS